MFFFAGLLWIVEPFWLLAIVGDGHLFLDSYGVKAK